jgi:hypothetical protein
VLRVLKVIAIAVGGTMALGVILFIGLAVAIAAGWIDAPPEPASPEPARIEAARQPVPDPVTAAPTLTPWPFKVEEATLTCTGSTRGEPTLAVLWAADEVYALNEPAREIHRSNINEVLLRRADDPLQRVSIDPALQLTLSLCGTEHNPLKLRRPAGVPEQPRYTLDPWPFKSDTALLRCRDEVFPTVTVNRREYALNGIAMGARRWRDLKEALLPNPKYPDRPDIRISSGDALPIAQSLCETPGETLELRKSVPSSQP